MKLFEATWRDGYSFFERYYDTNLNKSMQSRVDLPYEWYEPSSRGNYTYILDDSITLDKKQGNAKQGREHYGFMDPMYRNIRDNYWNQDKYNLEPRIWYLDIETRVGTCSTGFPVPEKAAEPISMFQFFDNKENIMILLGLRDWDKQEEYVKKFDFPVRYIKCNNEVHMIETFLSIFKKLDPLIIYAWNGAGFDYPYIHNRMKNLGMDTNLLSNYGNVSYSESEFQGRTEFKIKVDGHFFVDLMDVYKKFTFSPRPSYSLDTIAEIELGENKVDHSNYGSFDDFYVKGHDEFVYYGITDTYLIKRLDEKLNFTVLMNMIAEKMGVQLGDSMGTVKPWSQYISNKSYQNRQVMPMRNDNPDPHVVGGYVRDPNKGKHKWVVSADVNSMYPLLGMVGFNMSPETYIPKYKLPDQLRDIVLQYFNDQEEEKRLDLPEDVWNTTTKILQENDLALGINGAVFKKDKLGMVPEMVQEIYDGRKKAKKTMFDYTKQAILIKEILKEK
jgi:DNA polymerase elongation subunit (family B)